MNLFKKPVVTGLITTALTLGLVATASAQNLAKFTISDQAAKKTLMKNEINADTARKILDKCIDIATKANMPITIFILTPTGQIVASHRMDGQVPINIETALLKAQSVLVTRDSTHLRANMIATNIPQQIKWHAIGVFTTSGGLPIVVDGQMIGTIGIGGGSKDEEMAFEALEAVVGPQPPLAPNAPPAAPAK
ncbi:MAG: heme-binding protein [Bryobacteraceae bacterium]